MPKVSKLKNVAVISVSTVVCIVSLLDTEPAGGQQLPKQPGFQKKNAADAQVAPEEIVARVNGVPIMGADLNRAVESMKQMLIQSGQRANLLMIPPVYFQQQALDTLIVSELLFQQAKKEGVEITDDQLQQQLDMMRQRMGDEAFEQQMQSIDQEAYKNSIRKTMYINEVITKKIGPVEEVVTEKAMRESYDMYKDNMQRRDDTVRISHLFVNVAPDATEEQIAARKQRAQEARDKLAQGADWNDVVNEYSDSEKDNGGDVGYYPLELFKQSVVEGELPENLNEISEVLRTDEGFHILKITDRKAKGGTLTFDEARPNMAEMVYQNHFKEKVEEVVSGLKKEANIDVYLDIPSDW